MTNKQIAPNLILRTRSNGNSFYSARFKKNGKLIERSLGSADLLTLKQAKLALAQLMLEFDVETKKTALTFKEATERALKDIANVKQWRNAKSEHQWRQTLTDYALPYLGRKDVAEITRDDILDVLMRIWNDKPETANRLRGRIESVMAWCIRRGFRKDSNPATWRGNLEFDLPRRSKVSAVKHHEAMTFDEVKKAVAYCLNHPSPVSAAILFGIATASRVGEFRFARKEEIVKDVWMVPPERRKDSKPYPHRVPLSELAKKAVKMAKGKDHLFVSDFGVIAADSPRLKLVAIVGRPVTMHGCRSVFRDWCAENGIDRVLAEKSLMHATGNEVEQAYQRSDLLEQRREVMQKWAEFLLEK